MCVVSQVSFSNKLRITSFVDNFVYKPFLFTSVCLNMICNLQKLESLTPINYFLRDFYVSVLICYSSYDKIKLKKKVKF